MVNFIPTILKGFSQVFLQENIPLRILIIIGLAISSPVALILAFIGNITAFITSTVLGAEKTILDTGLLGFNGVLIGTMISFYVKQMPMAIFLTILMSTVATIIFFLFFKNNIPPFALPFTLMGWAILILLKLAK